MEFKGTIKKIMDEQKVTEKFKKREFVIADGHEQYPQFVIFEMTNDKCSLLDSFKEGDEVKIDFQLRGREWKNPQGEVKYFNTLSAFRIFPAKADGAKSEPAKQPVRQTNKPTPSKEDIIAPKPDDNLPF